jgi:hypothetical protein
MIKGAAGIPRTVTIPIVCEGRIAHAKCLEAFQNKTRS